MNCKKCDSVIEPVVNFCPSCGARIEKPVQVYSRTERFSEATSLYLGQVYADFCVTLGASSDMVVTIEGDEETVKNVRLNARIGMVVLESELPGIGPVRSNDFVIRRNGEYYVHRLKLDETKKLTITVSLSRSFFIKADNFVFGTMAIVGDGVNAKIRDEGQMSIVATSFSTLDLLQTGGSRFSATDITSSLTAQICGGGRTSFRSIRSGDVSLSGGCQFDCGSMTNSFSLASSGGCKVNIDSALSSRADIRMSGGGEVIINAGNIRELYTTVSGGGIVSFGGEVGRGYFTASGGSTIRVTKCNDVMEKQTSGSSDVRFG